MLSRAEHERTSIFTRYDVGRKNGANIDHWEESDYKIYEQVDKYGFIQADKNDLEVPVEKQRIQMRIQQEREKKWKKMLAKWKSDGKMNRETQEKLAKRVYKGVPNTYRSKVWQKLLNLDEIMKKNEGVYDKFLKIARDWATEAKQIDSDVNRQFREHIDFQKRYSLKQISLYKVLVAYSMYNMEVGYCQGMAGLAGVLLMYLDEEEAFWGLNELLTNDRYGMHGFFMLGFPKLMRFTKHHDKIITKCIPKLKKHLDSHGVDSILYALKWFFVVFVERVPFDLCLRIWDIFLLDGERVLVAMAYTILKLHKNKLMKLKELDSITTFLQSALYKDFGYENDFVIRTLELSMDELRRLKLVVPLKSDSDIDELNNIRSCLGKFIEPNVESKIGLRQAIFTQTERNVTDNVLAERQQNQLNNQNSVDTNSVSDNGDDNISQFTTGGSTHRLRMYKSNHSISTSLATSFCSDNDDDDDDAEGDDDVYNVEEVVRSRDRTIICDIDENEDSESENQHQITRL